MTVELRAPSDDDWPAILNVAHDAASWAGAANEQWLANRRAFDRARLGGAHYVAIDGATPAPGIVGYGAIEGDGAERWRVFVVMAPARLLDGTGDAVLDRLTSDLARAGARTAWMREEARDTAILTFATAHGFVEKQRFSPDGIEIVSLERYMVDARAGTPATLLDKVMPRSDVHEVHRLVVRAPRDAVYAAVRDVTIGEIRLVAPLMFLRMLPARLRGRPLPLDRSTRAIEGFRSAGFVLLGETPSREIALGAIGRFWSISGNRPIEIATVEQFTSFAEPGYAKAAMNILLLDQGAHTRIVTETRVVSTSPDAKKSFGRYWFAIRWGSSAIRRSWLRAIKRRVTANGRVRSCEDS